MAGALKTQWSQKTAERRSFNNLNYNQIQTYGNSSFLLRSTTFLHTRIVWNKMRSVSVFLNNINKLRKNLLNCHNTQIKIKKSLNIFLCVFLRKYELTGICINVDDNFPDWFWRKFAVNVNMVLNIRQNKLIGPDEMIECEKIH